MTDINFRELYDEHGVHALVKHSFSLAGPAYELLTQKIKDEADLMYIQSTATGLPYLDLTLDGTIIHVFDLKPEAEMKMQDLTLQGYEVELKPLLNLFSMEGMDDPTRERIFPCLFKHGFEFLRINDMLTIPLSHIAPMPSTVIVDVVEQELINPKLWVKALVLTQEQEAGHDTETLGIEILDYIGASYFCVPIEIVNLKPGQTATLENFSIPRFCMSAEEVNDPATILVFPDNNSKVLFGENPENEVFTSGFEAKMQFIMHIEELLDKITPENQLCIQFTSTLTYRLPAQYCIYMLEVLTDT